MTCLLVIRSQTKQTQRSQTKQTQRVSMMERWMKNETSMSKSNRLFIKDYIDKTIK